VRDEIGRLRREVVDEAEVPRRSQNLNLYGNRSVFASKDGSCSFLSNGLTTTGEKAPFSITFHAGGIKAFAERGSVGEYAS
jgi:hypothetical protein